VRTIFLAAWHAKVKGITIYRYGSKDHQVLTLLSPQEQPEGAPVQVDTGFAGGCAAHLCEF
jgi:ribonucleoside-diphosphate reductase alpha chain